jgi:hypothetical protein
MQVLKQPVTRKQLSEAEEQWVFEATRPGSQFPTNPMVVAAFAKQFHDRAVSETTVGRIRRGAARAGVKRTGRKPLLKGALEERLFASLQHLRAAGLPLSAAKVAAGAKGILSRDKNGITDDQGGPAKFSVSWATKWLKRNGFRVRSATTDRTIGAEEIAALGPPFFQEAHDAEVKHPASALPRRAASIRAVQPSASSALALMSPSAVKASTVAALPLSAASISAVRPFSRAAFTLIT